MGRRRHGELSNQEFLEKWPSNYQSVKFRGSYRRLDDRDIQRQNERRPRMQIVHQRFSRTAFPGQAWIPFRSSLACWRTGGWTHIVTRTPLIAMPPFSSLDHWDFYTLPLSRMHAGLLISPTCRQSFHAWSIRDFHRISISAAWARFVCDSHSPGPLDATFAAHKIPTLRTVLPVLRLWCSYPIQLLTLMVDYDSDGPFRSTGEVLGDFLPSGSNGVVKTHRDLFSCLLPARFGPGCWTLELGHPVHFAAQPSAMGKLRGDALPIIGV